MANTSIERINKGLYWDKAWSLVGGCTYVSEGCSNCWSASETHMRAGQTNPKIKDRYAGLTTGNGKWNGQIRLHTNNLDLPLKTKKPTVWAIWNDLFHEDVPDDFIAKVWDMMWKCSQHTFLVLTKRPERMKQWVEENAYAKHFGWVEEERPPFVPCDLIHIDDLWMRNMCGWESSGKCDCNGGYICDCPPDNDSDTCEHGNRLCMSYNCPIACSDPSEKKLKENGLEGQYEIDDEGYSIDCDWMELYTRPRTAFAQNVWLGVTAENQARADERIPIVLQMPAAVRFVSVEPMLGPVDVSKYLRPSSYKPGLNQIICGGETGPKARPTHPDWVKSLRDQCKAAETSFFFKSWGDWAPDGNSYSPVLRRVGKKNAGRLLDGVEHNEFPGVRA